MDKEGAGGRERGGVNSGGERAKDMEAEEQWCCVVCGFCVLGMIDTS